MSYLILFQSPIVGKSVDVAPRLWNAELSYVALTAILFLYLFSCLIDGVSNTLLIPTALRPLELPISELSLSSIVFLFFVVDGAKLLSVVPNPEEPNLLLRLL